MSEFNRNTFSQRGMSFEADEDAASLAEQLQEDLEVRIGQVIAQGKSGEEMRDFDEADDTAALAWLKVNKPNYRDIVQNVTADVRRELLVYRSRLPGAKLLRALEQDATPVERLGLPELRRTGIKTAGELVDSLESLPASLDRGEITRTVNRLWEHLTAPAISSKTSAEDPLERRMEVIHPEYGRGTIVAILPDPDYPMIEVDFGPNEGVYALSQAWVGEHCEVRPYQGKHAAKKDTQRGFTPDVPSFMRKRASCS